MSFWNDKNISAAYRLAKTGTSDSGIAAQSQSKTTTMMRFPPAPQYPTRFPATLSPSPYQPQLPSPSQYQPQFPSPGPNPGNYRARPGPPGRRGPRPLRQGPPAPRGPKMGYGYQYSPCFRCGGAHVPSSCPYLQFRCHTCSSVGHLARMCPQAAPKGQ